MSKLKLVVGTLAIALLGAGCARLGIIQPTESTYERQGIAPVTSPERAEPAPAAAPAPAAKPSPQLPASTSKTYIIRMNSIGFNPSAIIVKAGDTVKFVNEDSIPHWPASGMHPTHQICPGFDALRGLDTGDSYSFTFREAKTCPMHDHLNASIHGSITVQ